MCFIRTWLVAICLPTIMGVGTGWTQTVVLDSNVSVLTLPLGEHSLELAQDVAGNDFTFATFNNNAGNLSLVDFSLDEGSDWYQVVPGEELSKASTLAGNNNLWGTSLDLNSFPVSPNPIFVEEPFFANPLQLTATSEFYLGFATTQGTSANPTGPGDRDVFGWALVTVFGSGLPGEPQNPDEYFFDIFIESASPTIRMELLLERRKPFQCLSHLPASCL